MNDADFNSFVEQSLNDAPIADNLQSPDWDYHGTPATDPKQSDNASEMTLLRINAPWSDYVPMALVFCVVQFVFALAVAFVVAAILR